MAAKTFLQLQTDALTQVDELSGSGSATARTIIKSGINEAYAEIAGLRDWETLKNTGTITTSSGDMEYTPITSTTSIPRIRRIDSLLDETNNRYLDEVARSDFERDYPYVDPSLAANQGTPTLWFTSSYTSNRDVQIKLWQVPNSTLTLRMWWYEEPVELVLDADVPRIPDQYHYGLAFHAITKYYEFQEMFQKAEYYRGKFNAYKATIQEAEYNDTDEMPEVKPQTLNRGGFVIGKIGRIYN